VVVGLEAEEVAGMGWNLGKAGLGCMEAQLNARLGWRLA
jgi:hypothetical protein